MHKPETPNHTAISDLAANAPPFPFCDVPNIAKVLGKLTESDRAVVLALIKKDPQSNWESVASALGMSVRQLYNYRTKSSVQEASNLLIREMCKADVPQVLLRLTKEARSGKPWAVKTFLEWAGEINSPVTQNNSFTSISDSNVQLSQLAAETLARLKERAKLIT